MNLCRLGAGLSVPGKQAQGKAAKTKAGAAEELTAGLEEIVFKEGVHIPP
jgi:hypothetical protein